MNISKPYKIALLVGIFIIFAIIGFYSSGLLPEYLKDVIPLVAIIVGSSGAVFAVYRKEQKNQSSDC